jgi:hypothetical protein
MQVVVAGALAVVVLAVGAVLAVRATGAKPAANAPEPAATSIAQSSTTPSASPRDDTIGSPVAVPAAPSGSAFLMSGGGEGAVITPQQAQTVVAGLWAMREQALHNSSTSTLQQIEAGPALAGDMNAMSCRCSRFDVLKPSNITAVVPKTSTYPAYFVGEVAAQRDESDGLFDLFVISRSDAKSSWRIALVTGYASDASTTDDLDDTGWAGDASGALGSDGHGFAELAAIWQHAKDTGAHDGGDFDTRSWLVSDRLDELAKYRQDTQQANGLRAHVTFAVDTTVPFRAVEASTGDIVCGAIRETAVYIPAAGHAIEQDADQLAFGATVPPGAYRAMTGTVDWQVCIEQYGQSKPVVFGWDPSDDGTIVGTPLAKGHSLPPDPAQKIAAPDDAASSAAAST